MYEEMLEEFEQFKADMKNGETFCKYIIEDDYEDEYSHNELLQSSRCRAASVVVPL